MDSQWSIKDLFAWGLLALGVAIGMLGKTAYRLLQNKPVTRRWILANALLFGLVLLLAANVIEFVPIKSMSVKRMLLIAGLIGVIGDRLILILLAQAEKRFTTAVDHMDFFIGSPVSPPTVGIDPHEVPKPIDPKTAPIAKLRDVLPLESELDPDMQVLLTRLDKKEEGKDGPHKS